MVDKDRSAEDLEEASDGENAEAEIADGRYSELPEPVRAEDMVATKDTRPVPDPKMGRDTETDFMLRNAGGFG